MIRLLIHLAALPFCLTELSKNSVHQTPTVLIKHPGEEVVINCSHSNPNFNMIQWYKQSSGKNDMALIGYARFSSLVVEDQFKDTYNVTGDGGSLAFFHIAKLSRSEDSAVYFCAARGLSGGNEAYFGGGTKLTVLEPDHAVTKPKVTVLPPSQKECRNPKNKEREKTIVCVASEFYPDHVSVSWRINGSNVREGVATDNAALRVGKYYRITSRLRVAAETWYNPSIKFTCIVTFYNVTNTDYPAHIFGETAVGDGMTRDKYLRITQTAKLSYGVFIIKSCIYGAFVSFLVWKLQGSAGKQHN